MSQSKAPSKSRETGAHPLIRTPQVPTCTCKPCCGIPAVPPSMSASVQTLVGEAVLSDTGTGSPITEAFIDG